MSDDPLGLSPANRYPGVSTVISLPDPEWRQHWDRIVCAEGIKPRLLNFALFCLVARKSISTVGLPSHGLAVLAGPPGTGKTTLAYGLANRAAEHLVERGSAERVIFVGVDPHALPSELLGASQRASAQLFERAIPDIAAEGSPVVVLLDEVEALAVNRRQASAGSNPIDVHRATQAVLTGLDSVARECRNVLWLATTNHTEAVDEAFLSRADVLEHMGKPTVDAIRAMLADSLAELSLIERMDPGVLDEVALECARIGLDARQVRKLVLRALIRGDADLAMSPESLTAVQLRAAVADA